MNLMMSQWMLLPILSTSYNTYGDKTNDCLNYTSVLSNISYLWYFERMLGLLLTLLNVTSLHGADFAFFIESIQFEVTKCEDKYYL